LLLRYLDWSLTRLAQFIIVVNYIRNYLVRFFYLCLVTSLENVFVSRVALLT